MDVTHALELLRGEDRLGGGEELALLEADVPFQQRSELGETSLLAALRGREERAQLGVLVACPRRELGRAACVERGEEQVLFHLEVRCQLGVEPLPDRRRVEATLRGAAREDEALVVLGREPLEPRVALHGERALSQPSKGRLRKHSRMMSSIAAPFADADLVSVAVAWLRWPTEGSLP
jgi:hypothetical protein